MFSQLATSLQEDPDLPPASRELFGSMWDSMFALFSVRLLRIIHVYMSMDLVQTCQHHLGLVAMNGMEDTTLQFFVLLQ